MEYFEDGPSAFTLSPMRSLLRVALTLLISIPACLALLIFLGLEMRRGMKSSS